jgi:hypothetical protein
MRKKLYIFKHLQKVKKVIFLPISIILRLIPIKFETLKPPTEQLAGDVILESQQERLYINQKSQDGKWTVKIGGWTESFIPALADRMPGSPAFRHLKKFGR